MLAKAAALAEVDEEMTKLKARIQTLRSDIKETEDLDLDADHLRKQVCGTRY